MLRDASGDVSEVLNGTYKDCVNRTCKFGLQNDFQVCIWTSQFMVNYLLGFKLVLQVKVIPILKFTGRGNGISFWTSHLRWMLCCYTVISSC